MKDYKEIAAEVFARREEYLVKQKKRRKTIAAVASVCAALCVVISVVVGYGIMQNKGAVDETSPTGDVDSIMISPTMPTTGSNGDNSGHDPDKYVPDTGPNHYLGVDDAPYGGAVENAADRAGVEASSLVVYGTVTDFDELGTNIICTLSVEKTVKGEENEQVKFNISKEDRGGFMALAVSGKGVFFLKEEPYGFALTNGGSSIFYEVGEDDFRSYDETGLICYYLTMEEIEDLTEEGL